MSRRVPAGLRGMNSLEGGCEASQGAAGVVREQPQQAPHDDGSKAARTSRMHNVTPARA